MEIVIAIASKIAEYTVGPIGQWLCYSCHYKSNMENLKNQATTLRDAKSRVQHEVEAASNNGNEIHDDVKRWLTKVDGILHQLTIEKLDGGDEEAESRNSNASCLNLKQRHQISWKAKKLVGNIAELLNDGNFKNVGYCPPMPNMVPVRNVDYMTLGSRMSVMKRVKEALGDANINKVGVSGLAGVGKSTLMEEICRQVKEKRLFDEVALAKVTNSPNLCRIQGDIAGMLGLKLDPHITEIERKAYLRARLEKDKEKKILVILDDIWKRLDLEEIGITPSERCKVLLTSRERRVLAYDMGIKENTFELDILGEQEAWILFEKMVGDTVKGDLVLRNEAIKVAKECAGLPIALVTVSRALKGQKSLKIWKDALVKLRRPNPEHDEDIWAPVYSCIQLSYIHLGKEVKSLFLLCALQDYYISYKDLLRYGFGLCLFHGILTLEEARDRLENLVSKLQDSCLLQKSPCDSGEFYMHDIVRHVAKIIASNDHNMFVMIGNGEQKAWPDEDAPKRCEALSICGGDPIHKYPNIKEFPKLRYFHVRGNNHLLESPDIFFEGMDMLEVLSLTNMQLLSLFPLANLRTLCLDQCTLGDIHGIGKLETLVILSLAGSDISNLPREIQSLTRLRLLDLSNCYKLRVIPPNVLSSLVNLEELYMQEIDVEWEVERPNHEEKNASLVELKQLSQLTSLEIDIPDANNLLKDLFFEKLERYKICIGDIVSWETFNGAAFSRMLGLKLNGSFQLDFGIKMLLKRTEFLYLDEENSSKSVLYEVDREDYQQLKHLHIQNNGNIKHILESGTSVVAFPILDTFVLKNMFSLEEICQDKLPSESFKNLKVLNVDNCEKLIFIFPSSIARGLSLLEELKITRCNNLGAIFVKEEEDGIEDQGDMMLFGRLQTLVLEGLPKLVGFLSTKDSIMADCRETNSEGNHDLQLPLLHHDQGKLPLIYFKNLKVLRVENCQKLRFLFSSSIARGLSLLEQLKIKGCNNMGAIVVTEEKDGIEDQGDMMLFGRLQTLELRDLPKLVGFLSTKDSFMPDCRETNSEGNHDLQLPLLHHDQVSFPSLQTLRMWGLPKIKYAWSCGQEPKTVFRCLEQLQVLEIIDCGVEEIVAVEKGGEAVAIRTLVFPQVTQLKFSDLPRLKWFCQGVYVTKWPMLKKMKIERCDEVEIFASEVVSFEKTIKDQRQSEMSNIKQSLFSVDEHSFPSLETLEFWNMGSLEIIFGKLEGQNGKEPQVLISPASGTEESGATTHFASTDQVAATSFPNIQELSIDFCHKLLHVFQSNLHATTTTLMQSLTRLNITYCSSLESIFGNMEGQNGKESQVLMAPSSGTEDGIAGHIEFPILTLLSLFELPKLKWIFEGVHTNLESWPSLKHLSLWECGEQVNKMIWGSKFASSSSSQENQLPTCIQQPMFVVEEGTFPNLEHLLLNFSGNFSDFPNPSSLLTGLPNLLELKVYNSVWEEIFPYELVDREIRLRRLTVCLLIMVTHLWKEDNTQPCQLFHNMEYLNVSQCGKLKNIVPSSVSLHNLTGLEISSCHGLINLLTSSTAKTLVQLKRMTVIDCKRITEIVAMEDGEANVAIIFNKLTVLTLDGLPNLTHFGFPYSFGFPSLYKVIVRCCPEMKTFSHGVLSTPKLTAVCYDDRWNSKQNLYCEDDLNTTTRCLWEEANQYDTRLLFRERVENSEEDEDHPSEDEDHP
ncbi:uncharacterized protein LOC122317791 isoform X3 [Carya illinoinensis]|uniref:uncharacterized protein LOC122317791 isoform X3 n=1 Tax=Carya illinoinensis TaxID=32201 RepID=UPI001C719354|nr:uncharacterized protein LOC122317791 isoform X3 [Carya illinoinensis]